MIYERTFGGIAYRARPVDTADDGTGTWFIEYDQDSSGRFEHRATFTQKGDRYIYNDTAFRSIDDLMVRYYYGAPS